MSSESAKLSWGALIADRYNMNIKKRFCHELKFAKVDVLDGL